MEKINPGILQKYGLKSDYFRIEIQKQPSNPSNSFELKSDYFRIEMTKWKETMQEYL